MSASLPRKYYCVAYAELDTIPKKEGNVICTYDTDGWYYDIANPAGSASDSEKDIIRRKAGAIEFVAGFPPEVIDPDDSNKYARREPETVFVIRTNPEEEPALYAGYCWEGDMNDPDDTGTFYEIFNNFNMVRTISSSSKKFYLAGSDTVSDSLGNLYKNPNIFIEDGALNANLVGNVTGDVTGDVTGHLYGEADTASLATRAINDNAATPKPITGYLNNVQSNYTSNPGSILTFTRGDGNTFQVQVSDTKYEVYTADPNVPGLVPGINTTESSDNTNLLLTGSGWVDIDNIAIPSAQSADEDGEGQNIADTYIKDLSFDNSTREMTVTKGDDDTSTISIPDTSYSVFSTSEDGLAPMTDEVGDTAKFLRGDATWQSVVTPDMIYSGSDAGLVPTAPSSTENFLRSDGTWFGTFDNDEDGLVPKTSTAASTDILHADGTWSPDLDTVNTTGATQASNVQIQSPMYVIGAATQGTNPQTYTDANVYYLNNKLYSNNAEVVTTTESQNLTNKTFDNKSLGSAAFTDADSVIDGTDPNYNPNNVPTNNAVVSYVSSSTSSIYNAINAKLDNTVVAPMYDDTSTSYAVGDYVMYTDVNGTQLYECTSPVSAPAGDLDPNSWTQKTLADILKYIIGQL